MLEGGSRYGIYAADAHMPWLLGRAIKRKPSLVTLTFSEIHPSDSWLSAPKAPKPVFVLTHIKPDSLAAPCDRLRTFNINWSSSLDTWGGCRTRFKMSYL